MSQREAYLYYQAGQAVAAVHLRLAVRHIGANPADGDSHIIIPRDQVKSRIILWLTGMAAEKKGVGRSDPLRRTRNRARVRALIESLMTDLTGPHSRRLARAKSMVNQAQDRANAICNNLFPAIEEIAQRLRNASQVSGDDVHAIVAAAKAHRPLDGLFDEDGSLR